jgi:hypothetical protein
VLPEELALQSDGLAATEARVTHSPIIEGSYRERVELQLTEWVAGRPRHNGRREDPRSECCPDFSCCKPQYLAPLEERELFASVSRDGGESRQRGKMLGMFLGRLIAGEAPGKKVAITDGEGPP